MRLSRSRLWLRITLLSVGGAFMLWRAAESRSAARSLQGGPALLEQRLALVSLLMGLLALLTAAGSALALRRRPPRRGLGLGGPPGAAPSRDADRGPH